MLSYGTRLKYAFRSFFSILDHGRLPEDIAEAITGAREAPEVTSMQPVAEERAVQVLALLQRDGRLVDFLMEDLAGYPDAQVGAAVRDVHAACRAALERYLTLAPVIDRQEGETVTIQKGTDPARIKVVGNIAGGPPHSGVLRHRGWDAARVELPSLPQSGRSVIAPAEVEII